MGAAPDRVHAAARGFDRGAAAYERSRPEYPADAIAYLAQELGIGAGRVVLDLAAGTGKLTRALLPLGARVIAVEPSEGMRAVFRSAVPTVEPLDGTAESIPLPDHCVDAVGVGQAFHWFRGREALTEIARVLRPLGALGLIWNKRDESVGWVAELGRIINSRDRRGAPSAWDESWMDPFRTDGPFGPLTLRVFRFSQPLRPEGIVERALSVSFLAAAAPDEQRAVAAEVSELLSTDDQTAGRPIVEFPYRTDVYVSRRRDARSDTARPDAPAPRRAGASRAGEARSSSDG